MMLLSGLDAGIANRNAHTVFNHRITDTRNHRLIQVGKSLSNPQLQLLAQPSLPLSHIPKCHTHIFMFWSYTQDGETKTHITAHWASPGASNAH